MTGRQTPVYLFTGFLDAGKTTFIQSTLEDRRFNSGEKTLLICCEEGEKDYDVSSFSGQNVFRYNIEDQDDFTEERLLSYQKDTCSERVLIEYNGMWPMTVLFDNLTENWIVAQDINFADSSTYAVYNSNMRNLVFDKLQSCDVIVFHKCSPMTNKDELHKIVRQANRRCNIFYEDENGNSEMDEKTDPLPFDINADIIQIADRDYAYFYADLTENLENYEGKKVSFTALYPGSSKPLPDNLMVAGRMLMNCCAADTQFAGLACYLKTTPKPPQGSWFRLTGKIRLQRNRLFSGKIPVIDITNIEKAKEPEDPVATFY